MCAASLDQTAEHLHGAPVHCNRGGGRYVEPHRLGGVGGIGEVTLRETWGLDVGLEGLSFAVGGSVGGVLGG